MGTLESSLLNIRKWMNENRLKMNDSKTEFTIFGTRQQKSKITTSCINVNNIQISKSQCVKYLGAYLDYSLTTKHHITEKCKTAWMHKSDSDKTFASTSHKKRAILSCFAWLLSTLTLETALFAGLPKVDIQRLHRAA